MTPRLPADDLALRRARARRTAWLLGVFAVLVFAGFFVVNVVIK